VGQSAIKRTQKWSEPIGSGKQKWVRTELGIAQADFFGFSLGGLVSYAITLPAVGFIGDLSAARPPARACLNGITRSAAWVFCTGMTCINAG
jgi:hypothetical protein